MMSPMLLLQGKAVREALKVLKEEERRKKLENLELVLPEANTVKDAASEQKQVAQ